MNTLVSAADKQHYREHGYFITPPLFPPDFIRAVSDELDALWETETARTADAHDGPGFMLHLAQRNAVIAGVFQHPALLEIARGMLGPDADLCYDQVVMKQPQGAGNAPKYDFAFHQDSYYALSGESGWSREIYLDDSQTFQGWLALTPTTVQNGTLFVVPGAHRHGLLQHTAYGEGDGLGFDASRDERVDFSRKIPVLLQPGQLLVFSGLLPHGSGANLSGEARKIIQFSISRPGGRDAELAIPLVRDGHAVFEAALR